MLGSIVPRSVYSTSCSSTSTRAASPAAYTQQQLFGAPRRPPARENIRRPVGEVTLIVVVSTACSAPMICHTCGAPDRRRQGVDKGSSLADVSVQIATAGSLIGNAPERTGSREPTRRRGSSTVARPAGRRFGVHVPCPVDEIDQDPAVADHHAGQRDQPAHRHDRHVQPREDVPPDRADAPETGMTLMMLSGCTQDGSGTASNASRSPPRVSR